MAKANNDSIAKGVDAIKHCFPRRNLKVVIFKVRRAIILHRPSNQY